MSIRVEKHEGVTTVILDRPEVRNAVDVDTAHALTAAFDEFDHDPSQHAAVLWGDHGNFCAGADLKAVASGRFNDVDPEGDGPLGPTRRTLSKPVIAAVAGYAVAGGLELALWCDLRVAEESAQFGVFCRRWGVPLIDGGTVRLPRIIGQGRALEMILTGRPVAAKEALEWGLANRVVLNGESRAAAEEWAQQLGAFPQVCMRHDRLSSLQQWNLSLQAALTNEGEHGLKSLESESLSGAQEFASGKGRHGKFA
ncbi:MAG: crotonase/enoyl-CoA hydratase family protein [Candidatus Hydrogenedens sp.]|nr:crotonase/enoyl-CoA hydratase family protein [Candidatus Hydrogenedens sp.]